LQQVHKDVSGSGSLLSILAWGQTAGLELMFAWKLMAWE
jgi:hypothetical protein